MNTKHQTHTKIMTIKKALLYIFIGAVVLQLISCSRYTGRACSSCGCGVWYPKKFKS